MKTYEIRHIVGFEETNVVGNVYFVNHLKWQGRCREMFLREHAPEVLDEIEAGLSLATVRCSCDYFAELVAFDEVAIRMRLERVAQTRIALAFEYVRITDGADELVARGEQEIATLRRTGGALVPVPIPVSLRRALEPYLAASVPVVVGGG